MRLMYASYYGNYNHQVWNSLKRKKRPKYGSLKKNEAVQFLVS
jgi:hypothetical protein